MFSVVGKGQEQEPEFSSPPQSGDFEDGEDPPPIPPPAESPPASLPPNLMIKRQSKDEAAVELTPPPPTTTTNEAKTEALAKEASSIVNSALIADFVSALPFFTKIF